MEIFYSGKSKLLSSSDVRDRVYMTFKDEMRTADGRYFAMEEKGVTLAYISATLFRYLKNHGVSNHFVSLADEKSLLVTKLEMLPFEFVIRRFAEGSYLKRNP